jgi:hypothetical protein
VDSIYFSKEQEPVSVEYDLNITLTTSDGKKYYKNYNKKPKYKLATGDQFRITYVLDIEKEEKVE